MVQTNNIIWTPSGWLKLVRTDNTKCTYPGCSKLYEMQSRLARPENPNPKWPVPKDLMEDNWDRDWQSTSSGKVSDLVQRLKALCGTDGECRQ
ncbi:hypothetical protein Fmac_011612 [Flemingia macrophylla]|uniref:Uncharacterized protein n=1 Tax=Flemingia macrophylla TaxID=520843 RepID=A0ABD1MMY9_9FABA